MANVMLRPDLKTASGEVFDIVVGGKYAGSLSLVYREGDRISGTALIDRHTVPRKKKEDVVRFVQSYMQWMVNALQAPDCEVIVAYGDYDRIIASEENIGVIEEILEEPPEEDPIIRIEYDEDGKSPDEEEPEWLRMRSRGRKSQAADFELVIVDEKRNEIEYHVYDGRQRLVAEVFLNIFGFDVSGEIHWRRYPSEKDIERVMDLIVSDFDEDEVDSFSMDMVYRGEVIQSVELMHEDLIDEQEENIPHSQEEYTILLVRDDGDALTYEIYQKSYGSLPIGTATVDIGQNQVTGIIDFREPGSAEDRETIATFLLREIEKEKDFDVCNLTMKYNEETIDEIRFENEKVH